MEWLMDGLKGANEMSNYPSTPIERNRPTREQVQKAVADMTDDQLKLVGAHYKSRAMRNLVIIEFMKRKWSAYTTAQIMGLDQRTVREVRRRHEAKLARHRAKSE